MAKIKSFAKFLLESYDQEEEPKYVKKFRQLVEHGNQKPEKSFYAVQISFDSNDNEASLMLEHISLKQFKSTRNRYVHHPAQMEIPVKAHYHVFPPNSTNKELYAVNMDGTAHHKRNRGVQIPPKEADELRSMGVDIDPSNILEMIELPASNENQLILESLQKEIISVFLIFEE